MTYRPIPGFEDIQGEFHASLSQIFEGKDGSAREPFIRQRTLEDQAKERALSGAQKAMEGAA